MFSALKMEICKNVVLNLWSILSKTNLSQNITEKHSITVNAKRSLESDNSGLLSGDYMGEH